MLIPIGKRQNRDGKRGNVGHFLEKKWQMSDSITAVSLLTSMKTVCFKKT
jgi:hypothetical protein